MKQVLMNTKRILAVLLSMAMITAYLPQSLAYADTLGVEDAQADLNEEEVGTGEALEAAEKQEPEAPEVEENIDDDKLYAQGDVEVIIIPDDASTPTVKIYDGNIDDNHASQDFASTQPGYVKKVKPADGEVDVTPANNTAYGAFVDSTKDYTLLLEPVTQGHILKEAVFSKIEYTDYTGLDNVSEATANEKKSYDETTSTKASTLYNKPVEYASYIDDDFNNNTMSVTLPSSLLATVKTAAKAKKDSTVPKLFVTVGAASADEFVIKTIKAATGTTLTIEEGAKGVRKTAYPSAGDYVRNLKGSTNPLLGTNADKVLEGMDPSKIKVVGIVSDKKTGEEIARMTAAATTTTGIADEANWTKTNWIAYNGTSGDYAITVDDDALALAYKYKRDISIEIDASEAGAAEKVDIEVHDVKGTTDAPKVQFWNNTTGETPATRLPQSATSEYKETVKPSKGHNYSVRVKPTGASASGTRTLKKVWYSIGGKETEVPVGSGLGSDLNATGGYFTIPGSEVKGKIDVYATTEEDIESVTVKDKTSELPVSNKAEIYNTDGTKATSAPTGEVFNFTVHTNDKYVVTKVEYTIGTGDKTEATLSNGVYSTKTAVTDTLTFIITVSQGDGEFTVKAVEDTRIHSVYAGNVAGFVAYWNNLYGTNYSASNAEDLKALQVSAGMTDLFAFTMEKGANWPTNTSHWGALVQNSTYKSGYTSDEAAWTLNCVGPSDRVSREANTKGENLVTLFCRNSDCSTQTAAELMSLEPFVITGGGSGNVSDADAKANAKYVGEAFSFTNAYDNSTKFNAGSDAGVTNPSAIVTASDGSLSGKVLAEYAEGTDPATATMAVKGQPFYFQVEASTGYAINSVSYSMEAADGTKRTGLIPEALAKAGYYKIPSVTGKINISVKTDKVTEIVMPTNENVNITYNDGTPAKAGEAVKVSDTQNFSFKITPKKDNVVVKDIYYYPTSLIATQGAGSLSKPAGAYGLEVAENAKTAGVRIAEYTITKVGTGEDTMSINVGNVLGSKAIDPDTASAITADQNFSDTGISLYVETEEAVDKTVAASNYFVEFKNDAENAYNESTNPKIEQTYKSATATKDVNNLASQKLWLTMGETANLVSGTNKTTLYTAQSAGQWTSAVTKGTEGYTVELSTGITDSTNAVVTLDDDKEIVTAVKAGTDTITVKYSYYNPSATANEGAKLVYTGTMPVEVVNLYDRYFVEVDGDYDGTGAPDSSIIAVRAKADETAVVPLAVFGVNGRTKAVERIAIPGTIPTTANGIKKIEFNLGNESDNNKTFYFKNSEAKLGYVSKTTANAVGKEKLYVTSAKTNKITVSAKVTLGGKTTAETVESKVLDVIAEDAAGQYGYVVLPVISGTGRSTVSPYAYTRNSINTAVKLYKSSTNLSSANVAYRVFEITKTGSGKIDATFRKGLTDENAIKDAIETKGYLKEVTSSAVFSDDTLVNWDENTIKATAGTDAANVVYASIPTGASKTYAVKAEKVTKAAGSVGATTRIQPTIRINNVKVTDIVTSDVPEVAFTVNNNIKTYNVDLYTEDTKFNASGNLDTTDPVYENKLDATKYLADKGDTSDIEYIIGSQEMDSAKYLLKATTITSATALTTYKNYMGKYRGVALTELEDKSTFKLPKETDFVMPQDKRTLVGWREINATGTSGVGYYAPGAEISISAADRKFVAVWVDKYVSSGTKIMNGNLPLEVPSAVYDGSSDYYTEVEGVTTTDPTKAIKETTYPTTLDNASLVLAKSDKAEATIPAKIKLVQNVGFKSTITSSYITDLNLSTDLNVKTIYKDVKSIAEDATTPSGAIAIQSDNKSFKVTGGNGSEVVKLKYEYEEGTAKYTGTMTNGFKTRGTDTWSLKISAEKSNVEAGTSPITLSVSEFKINGDSMLNTTKNTGINAASSDYDPYQVEWTVSGTGTAEVKSLKAVTGTPGSIEVTNADKAEFTPLAYSATPVTVTCKITDLNGNYETATTQVTVAESAYEIIVEDANGTVIGKNDVLEVAADRSAKEVAATPTDPAIPATSYKFKAVEKGKTTGLSGGTWSIVVPSSTDEDKLFGGTTQLTPENAANNYYKGYAITNDFIGDGEFSIAWTKGETVYRRTVKASSFYTVMLVGKTGSGSGTAPEANEYFYVTEGTAKTQLKDAETKAPLPATIKVGKALETTEGTTKYYNNIPLTGYSAVYVGTDGKVDESLALKNWYDGSSKYYADSIEKLEGADFATNGNVFLYANMHNTPASVSGYPTSTVVLSNEKGKTNYREVSLQVTPIDTAADIIVTADKINMFKLFDGLVETPKNAATRKYTTTSGDYSLAPTWVDGSETKSSLFDGTAFKALAPTSMTGLTRRVDTFTLGAATGVAGKTTISIYSVDKGGSIGTTDKPIATFDAIISGLNENADGTFSYVKEDGSLAKSESITIGSDTYYFDENGLQITDAGITTINGKKVLIIDGGKIAPKGIQTYKDNKYAIGEGGEVLSGWVNSSYAVVTSAADGVYYADPAKENVLANGYYKVVDKNYIFASHIKQKATSASGYEAYKLSDTDTKYINAAGEVALSEFIAVGDKHYIVDENGNLIPQSKATKGADGKYTYNLNGKIYEIADDNTAKLSKEFFLQGDGEWKWSWNTVSSKPDVTVTFTYKADDGETITDTPAVTVNDGVVIKGTVKQFTATATPTYAAKNGVIAPISKNKVYDTATGKETVYFWAEKKPTWNWTWTGDVDTETGEVYPSAEAQVIFNLKNSDGETMADENYADIAESVEIKGDKYTFTGTISYEYFESATSTETKTYTETRKQSYKVDKKTGTVKPVSEEYDGEEDGTFEVSFRDDITEYDYTGAAITPEVIVKNGEKTLIKDVDYTVSYSNNTNVVNKNATKAVIKGKGNYSTTTKDLPFTIKAKDLDSDDVMVGNLVFKTGTLDKNIKPTVTYYGKVLSLNSDYKVVPVADSEVEHDGKVISKDFTITAEGASKKNFTGSKTVTVSYVGTLPKFKVTTWSAPKDWSFTGEEHVLTSSNIVVEDVEFDDLFISYSDTVNAGTCKITITAAGKSGKVNKSVKIAAATTAKLEITNKDDLEAGYTFKNTGVKPFVALGIASDSTVTPTTDALVPGKDYKVTYSNNKQVWDVLNSSQGKNKKAPTAKITFLGNYKGNTTTFDEKTAKYFTIKQAALADEASVVMPETVTIGKNSKASEIFLKAGKNLQVMVNGAQLKTSEYAVEFLKGETPLGNNDTVAADDEISVKVTPKNDKMKALYGTESVVFTETYKIVTAATTDLTKAKVKFLGADGKTAKIKYTGTPIELGTSASDVKDSIQAYVTVTVGSGKNAKTLTPEELGGLKFIYGNNIEKGKATLIIDSNSVDGFSGSIATTFTINAGDIK